MGAAVGGCPDTKSEQPSQVCSKAYDKCELSRGVLGVCDVVECTNSQTGPCLTCRSQH